MIDEPWDDSSWGQRVLHVVAGLVFATLFVALLMAVVTAVSLIVGWATAENDRNFGGFVLARCACRS